MGEGFSSRPIRSAGDENPPRRVEGATMSIDPYLTEPSLLRHLHANRERQFLQVAERRRQIRAAVPSGPTQRVLRWRSAGPLAWARRLVSASVWAPAPSNGLHR